MDLSTGVYVIGKPGTGKTSYLIDLIQRAVAEGSGALVLDPHGGLVDALCGRLYASELVTVDVRDAQNPIGINLFAGVDSFDHEQVARRLDQVMQIFEKLFDLSREATPNLQQYLRHATLTMLANPGMTLAELPLLLWEKTVRDKLVVNLQDSYVRYFWDSLHGQLTEHDKRNRVSSTLNKVDEFLANPLAFGIVAQEQTTLPMSDLMSRGALVLVRLDAQMEQLTSLVGSVLVSEVLTATLQRLGYERPFLVVADEYQRFATPDFKTLLSEGRKFGVGTVIAHQFRDQLPPQHRGSTLNAGRIVVFQVNGVDARELAGNFDATPDVEQVQRGERQVMGISSNVFDHVLNNGHSDPQVRELVERHIRPLMERQKRMKYLATEGVPAGMGEDVVVGKYRSVYWFSGDTVAEGLHRLESGIASMMRGTDASSLVEGLWALREALNFAPRGDGQDLVERHDEEFFQSGHLMPRVAVKEPYAGLQYYPDNPPGTQTALVEVLRSNFSQAAIDRLVALRLTYWQERVGLRLRLYEERLARLREGLAYLRAHPGTTGWHMQQADRDSRLSAERLEPIGMAAIEQINAGMAVLPGIAQWEVENLLVLARPLVQLGRALQATPIMAPTGQYEPIFEERVRQYSDVSDQIASELATLPPLTARVKSSTSGQETMRVTPAGGGGYWHPYNLHGTPRSLVEDQVRHRHEQLRQPPLKPDEPKRDQRFFDAPPPRSSRT